MGKSGPRNDCCSLDCAFAAPSSFQYPLARDSRQCGDKSPGRHIRDLYQRDLYDLHAGRPMDCTKPSTAGAGRQRSCAGLQYSLPADATAEL